MVDDKKVMGLLVITVAGNDPLEFAVIFLNDQGTELIDIHGFAFKTVLESTDLDPVLEGTGDALPFLDDCIVLPAFYQEEVTLKLFQHAGEE